MTKYWISVRGVKGDAFTNDADVNNPRYLKIPDGEVPAPHHKIARAQWVKEIMDGLPLTADGVRTGDILFFVHGFNTNAAGTNNDHLAVANGLAAAGFDCRLISFDWPSRGEAFAYLLDRDAARLTAIALVNAGVKVLLAYYDVTKCDTTIHALAHSMGAFVVREALDHADDGQATATNWSLAQLVLIGGDVSQASMADDNPTSESMYRHCYRLTNYFNRYDAVLQVSNAKRIGLAPRVGRVGLPTDPLPQKGVNVDCSAHFHDTYGDVGASPDSFSHSHTWYFEDPLFYQDLATTLRGAINHQVIATRQPVATGQALAPAPDV